MNCSQKKIVRSSNKEITMANGSTADKARKARNKANESFSGVSRSKTEKIAKGIAKTAGVKLTPAEVDRAANLMEPRRNAERKRTAARATFIAGPNSPASKRAAAKRMEATMGGPAKKAAPKPVVKKAVAKKIGKK
jgi:hypothetical protein